MPDSDPEWEEREENDDFSVFREERRGVGEGGKGEVYMYTMRLGSVLESMREAKHGFVVRVSKSLI